MSCRHGRQGNTSQPPQFDQNNWTKFKEDRTGGARMHEEASPHAPQVSTSTKGNRFQPFVPSSPPLPPSQIQSKLLHHHFQDYLMVKHNISSPTLMRNHYSHKIDTQSSFSGYPIQPSQNSHYLRPHFTLHPFQPQISSHFHQTGPFPTLSQHAPLSQTPHSLSLRQRQSIRTQLTVIRRSSSSTTRTTKPRPSAQRTIFQEDARRSLPGKPPDFPPQTIVKTLSDIKTTQRCPLRACLAYWNVWLTVRSMTAMLISSACSTSTTRPRRTTSWSRGNCKCARILCVQLLEI